MKIEQTKAFLMEVDHLRRIADEYRHIVGHEAQLADLLQRIAHFRGREFAIKAAKKANQKVKFKAYQWEVI